MAMLSMIVITQAFAGHLGDLNLAAISIATTVIISIAFGILLGMASELETLCGQAYGAKQYHMLGVYLQRRSWIVLFICCILLLPLFIFAAPVLKLMGQPTNVADQTGLVAIWLIPFHLSLPYFTLQKFIQSQLKTAVIAWVSGIALAVHLLISWVFVYKLGVGVVGTAITLDFSWWLTVVGLFVYAVGGGCPLSWTGFFAQAFFELWDFFKLALASGVMVFISISAWESMIPLGFLAATGVRVANELGAGNANGAKFATIVSLITSLAVGFFFWSIIMAFHEALAMIFTSSSYVITMFNQFSTLLAFTILLNCIQPVLSGVAVRSGRQGVVAFVNIGSYYLVGVTLGVFFGWLQFGIKGIWAGMICGTVVQTLLLVIITIKCNWEIEAQKARSHISNATASYQ